MDLEASWSHGCSVYSRISFWQGKSPLPEKRGFTKEGGCLLTISTPPLVHIKNTISWTVRVEVHEQKLAKAYSFLNGRWNLLVCQKFEVLQWKWQWFMSITIWNNECNKHIRPISTWMCRIFFWISASFLFNDQPNCVIIGKQALLSLSRRPIKWSRKTM